ncbi:ribosome biogenesis GTPase YlqF [Anaerotignum faecicola]|nr:ribosome biogenesis GTPase YlqF [Anaerotignum faecicola]
MDINNINWYPGHMTKTRRMMEENISLVDVVIELLDARIPYSSKNPDIDALAKNKRRVVVLNKSDLADAASTEIWSGYFKEQGFEVILADAVKGKGVKNAADAAMDLMAEKIARLKAKGRLFVPVRAMIVGIPNVGKSTFINKYVGKSTAKTGDKPGVTRGKQWIKIKKGFELLDTPGILWPKFEDREVGLKLAFTGAINDDILDAETMALELIKYIMRFNPEAIAQRYKIELKPDEEAHDIFTDIGRARGFAAKGGGIDTLRTAKIFIDEFRAGKLGRITLELPHDIKAMEEEAKKRDEEKIMRDLERKREYRRKNG